MHSIPPDRGTLKRELQPAGRRARLEFNLQVILGHKSPLIKSWLLLAAVAI